MDFFLLFSCVSLPLFSRPVSATPTTSSSSSSSSSSFQPSGGLSSSSSSPTQLLEKVYPSLSEMLQCKLVRSLAEDCCSSHALPWHERSVILARETCFSESVSRSFFFRGLGGPGRFLDLPPGFSGMKMFRRKRDPFSRFSMREKCLCVYKCVCFPPSRSKDSTVSVDVFLAGQTERMNGFCMRSGTLLRSQS